MIGLPGAGKTYLGAELARRIGWAFTDIDQVVEQAAGMTVAQVFRIEGEASFRMRERRAIMEKLKEGLQVLALGGGAFEDRDTRQRVLASCTVIWIDTPEEVIVQRLEAANAESRPLFKGHDIREMLRSLASARSPNFYAAHFQISGADAYTLVDRTVATLHESGAIRV